MPDERDPPPAASEAHSRRERVRSAIDNARERLDAKRETSTTISVAYDTIGQDYEAGGPVLAAALGFRVFLFLVPYVCFLLIVAGYIADIFDRRPEELFSGKGIAALTAQGITTGHDLTAGARITAFVLVTYALFLSARSFLKVLRIVHFLVWHVPPSRMRRPTRATFVFIGVVTVGIVLSGLIDVLRHRVVIGGIAALALYTFVGFGVWWVVSWWLPHGDCDLLGLVPGAVVFALGLEVLQVVTVVWVPRSLESKSEIYGTIGAALVLLLWSYLLGRLMAVAAALNVALWHRRNPQPLPPPSWLVHVPLLGAELERVWMRITNQPGGVLGLRARKPDVTIALDNPRAPDVRALIERHLAFANEHSPPEDLHALDFDGLLAPDVSFYSYRRDGALLAIGAIRMLDSDQAELKSMHTAESARGQGIGRAMLDHLLAVARAHGVHRVSIETGAMDAFAPARALYAGAGFVPCEPFGEYVPSPNSICMTRGLAPE